MTLATISHALNREEARDFASRWLPAWTGNQPDELLAFYTEDVFYRDPAVPAGLSGRKAFREYLGKLLANNPDWIWTHEDSVPLESGFLNKWRLRAPVGNKVIECTGVCTVQFLRGLISRNEVYFDTLPLMDAIRDLKKAGS